MSRDSKSRVRVSRRNFLAKAMAGASGTAAVFGASTLPIDAQRTAAPGKPALEAATPTPAPIPGIKIAGR